MATLPATSSFASINAILYGAQEALQLLPRVYYDEVEKFSILSGKKQLKQKKKENLTNKKQTPFPGRSSIYF